MATIGEEQVVSPGMTNWPLWGPGNWRIFVPAPSSGPPPFARSASVRLSSRCTPSSSQAILLSLEALRKLPRSGLIDEPSARAFIPPHTATFPLFPTLSCLTHPHTQSLFYCLSVAALFSLPSFYSVSELSRNNSGSILCTPRLQLAQVLFLPEAISRFGLYVLSGLICLHVMSL